MHAASPISEVLQVRDTSDLFSFLSDLEILSQTLLAEHTQAKSFKFLKCLSVSHDAQNLALKEFYSSTVKVKTAHASQVWWCMPVFSALRR